MTVAYQSDLQVDHTCNAQSLVFNCYSLVFILNFSLENLIWHHFLWIRYSLDELKLTISGFWLETPAVLSRINISDVFLSMKLCYWNMNCFCISFHVLKECSHFTDMESFQKTYFLEFIEGTAEGITNTNSNHLKSCFFS